LGQQQLKPAMLRAQTEANKQIKAME
jgi:hypothetical protein